MSSPPQFRPGRSSHASSPSRSSTSSKEFSRSQRQDQDQPKPQVIELHPLLQSTQEAVIEHIYSHILWDLRENPLTAAQQITELGKQLSPDLLNAHATEPPVPFLNVLCEYPKPWSLVVAASALNTGGNGGSANAAGSRNTFPVFSPQVPMSAGGSTPHHPSFRSSSVSPPIVDIPPTPVIPTVPLPSTADTSRKLGVTISDLLLAVFNHLHTKSVGPIELDALPSKQRVRLTEAHNKRSKMTQGIGDGESALASPTSPTSPTLATSPFHFLSSSPSATSVPAVTSFIASTPTFPLPTDTGEVKLIDTLLSHTLFSGMDVVSGKEWTVTLSLKRPS